MRQKRTRRLLFISLLAGLLFLGHFGQPVYTHVSAQSGALRKVLVDAGDTRTIARLRSGGWQQLADYGAFSLWRETGPGQTLLLNESDLTPVDDSILLRDIVLHPDLTQPAATASEALTQASSQAPGIWIVQFIGPPLPAWLEALRASGLEIVAYLPNHAYLVWGEHPAQTLASLSAQVNFIQWIGAYPSLYRLAPDLRPPALASDHFFTVTVQFYNSPILADSLARLRQLVGNFEQSPASLKNWTNVVVRLSGSSLTEVSTWPDVINIEPYQAPQEMDEMQGQILAGNLIQSNGNILPSGPGYLNWLINRGFPTDPAQYPLVDLFDDGLDSGNPNAILHPDFFVAGSKSQPDRVSFIVNCTSEPAGNGVGGHGDLNAGIMAGYNAGIGAPYQDPQGYHLGLGISPFGRIAATKVFSNPDQFYKSQFDSSRCNYSFASMVYDAYDRGARITSNSWGASVSGDYDAQAQTYDALTRDASAQPGNQGMFHVFSAGNDGSAAQSVSSPGTAKNVLTVGATEGTRGDGIADGCLISNAASADNLAAYSSRGPTKDGRIKPDIMAPGTHIQGPAAQDSGFNGGSVCGGLISSDTWTPYYPTNQTLYTWSTGTSHAAPAVAGVAQLVYNLYQRTLRPGTAPSPAMLKALILNTPRYLTGALANDTLPSPNQGWGDADMGQIFDGGQRMLFDQSQLLTASGQTFTTSGYVTNTTRPLRITLAWTDAPGQPAAGVSAVNNLDLEVVIQGKTFRGNVMEGQYSIPDGIADSNNNVESVFLPAGVEGPFTVTVIARSLGGDGVPGNSSLTDQDFALVIDNATAEPLNNHVWLAVILR